MAIDVPMPKLGLTMEEATIIEWLVDDGESVEVDQPIMLIETDKTETEVGAPGTGRLHQMGQPGDVFACGVLVGLLLADGEQPPVHAIASTAPTTAPTTAPAAPTGSVAATGSVIEHEGRRFASPNARRLAGERGIALASLLGTGPGGRIVSEDVEAAPTPTAGGRNVARSGVAIATVAARNLADLLGIDLSAVLIDPIERRVTREGVARYVRDRLAAAPSSTKPESSVVADTTLLQEPTKLTKLSGMRGTIARRMQASLREMAQLTLTMDADMTAVLADRSDRRQSSATTPSITDYIVAATARALVRCPYANAQVTSAGIALLPEVHVGLAVAVDGGLLVPVISDAADRRLADLASETMRLAGAARAGSLTPTDLEGGTFSVSALGAYGVDVFTPVINPPNAGILGIGRLRDDVVLVDGQVSTVKRLTLSLTWDHRVFDGVPAAEFCRTIVELLSTPTELD